MAHRKTVTVEFLINMTNDICKDSSADRKDIRQGAMNLLETVLHSTKNYTGFRYLTKEEVKCGVPGVNHLNGVAHPDYYLRFENTDRTRVQYFLPRV